MDLERRSAVDHSLDDTRSRPLDATDPVAGSFDENLSETLFAESGDSLGDDKVGDRVNGEFADAACKVRFPERPEDRVGGDAKEEFEEMRAGRVTKEEFEIVGPARSRRGVFGWM